MHQTPRTNALKSQLTLVILISLVYSGVRLFTRKDRIRLKHISVEDGLSMEAVSCIIQDRDGYLWIGTQVGLNRFEGSSFKLFL